MNGRSESDEWLMGQVARGQREPLEKLVRRYASPLLTFIQRMVGDRHRSEELFQEVFLRVWTRRTQYRLERPFRSWLFAIAANCCRTDFRRQPPVAVLPLVSETASADGGSPVQTMIAAETAALVEAAVARLPPQQRMAVVLRVWSGMKFGEIAEIVGSEESTVRSNLHRALATLRASLGPRMNDPGERGA